ncbi:MAG: hypothetical protein C0617_09395 [Desulfuromonas sp.]|uniref:hypothetical protein n=1 Tax=Desulfuromonas sp. TaxID=892 RepID=UPI000CC95047|nr:hypothetical protein [Desulfuromonas sp.]PLX84026.1 MAG: hypothetical protein C0617_09395 [Desulfuromonas sp.]
MMLRWITVACLALFALTACGQEEKAGITKDTVETLKQVAAAAQKTANQAQEALEQAQKAAPEAAAAVEVVKKAAPKATAAVKNAVPSKFAPYVRDLQSSNPSAKRDAAKRIYKHFGKEPYLLAAVNGELLKGFNDHPDNKHYVDAMAWMVKVLSNSGDSKYRTTLEKIADEASSRKLQKYANKGLTHLL